MLHDPIHVITCHTNNQIMVHWRGLLAMLFTNWRTSHTVLITNLAVKYAVTKIEKFQGEN